MFDFVAGAIVGAGILTVVMMISMTKAAKQADEYESVVAKIKDSENKDF